MTLNGIFSQYENALMFTEWVIWNAVQKDVTIFLAINMNALHFIWMKSIIA